MKFAARLIVGCIFSLLAFTSAEAANICVIPTGTCTAVTGRTYTSTVVDIATALTNAADGDTIFLHVQTWTGHWTLPNKGVMTTGITITSDSDPAVLPPATSRMTPTYSAQLAKVVSDSTSSPAFNTADGANHYTLSYLEFPPGPGGYNELLRFGSNACVAGGYCQEFESQEPDHITLDHCYMHGDPITGQKRGVTIGGKYLTFTYNTIIGIAALGQDAYTIGGAAGRGPIDIENNTLEATTENLMFGGDDPWEMTIMTVTGTPTKTSASVTVGIGPLSGTQHNLSELHVGQLIAVLVNAGTERRHTILRSVTGTGTTGSITFDAIDVLPDVPGDIRTGSQISGLTVKNNYLYKRLDWLNPIIDVSIKGSATPTNVVLTPSTASGTLAAGTYYYYVYGINPNGYTNNTVRSTPSVVQSATLSAAGRITVAWTGVNNTNVTQYLIERGTSSTAATRWWTVNAGTTSFIDDGTNAGITSVSNGAITAFDKASYWQLKNLFEIKQAQNVLVSGNIFEYQWAGSDIGYSFWIKTVDQNGRCSFCQTRDVTIEKNIIRHVDGWLELSTVEFYPSSDKTHAPAPITNITVRNNLVYDSNSSWALSKGGTVTGSYAMSLSNYPIPAVTAGSVNVKIDHNTIIHTSRGALSMGGANHNNFTLTNNMLRHESYGLLGTGGQAEGTATLNAYAPNGYTVTKNAIAGANAANYPPGNFGPSVATWEGSFVNYSATGANNANGAPDYHLDPVNGAAYVGAGTDAADLGADIDAVFAATATAISGVSGVTPSNPVSITTTSLPNATQNVAYSQQINTQGGTAPLAWTSTGTLPPGMTLSTTQGVVSGTPTTLGTFTFTATVTDSATTHTSASQAFTIVVQAPLTSISITTTSPLPNALLSNPYSTTLAATGDRTPYTWAITSGTLPPGITFNTATGVISGTPTATQSATPVTFTVTGAGGTTATATLSLTVLNEVLAVDRPGLVVQNNLWPQIASPTLTFDYTEAQVFRRPVAPGAAERLARGDIWIDTSQNPPIPNTVTNLNPLTWSPIAGAPNSGGSLAANHNLLSSTHPDTQPDTPQAGDVITGVQPDPTVPTVLWTRLPGAPGYLQNDGTSTFFGSLTLPNTVDINTRLNSPILGVTNYTSFSPVTSPGCSTGNFGRIFYDAADNTMKYCMGGGSATPAAFGTGGTGSTTRPATIAYHLRPGSASTSWTNQPAAITEFLGTSNFRVPVDLSTFTQARLYMKLNTLGPTGDFCKLEYSNDNGVTTFGLIDGGSGTGSQVMIDGSVTVNGSNLFELGAWVTITAGAKQDTWLTVFCQGGNGTIAPTFGNIYIELK